MGQVTRFADGIVSITGMTHCRYGELVYIGDAAAIAMNISENDVDAVLLALFVGDNVYTLIGFSPFNKLMGKIVTPSTSGMCKPEELEKNRAEARELPDLTELAELPVKLNYQIKRMIRSFPALKSTRYESVVDKLRDHMDEIDKRRKELKRKLKEKK